jgi:TolB-like protein
MLAMLVWVVSGATPISVMAPGFQMQGVETAVADAVMDRFVTELTRSGDLKVVSGRDLTQALGVERQKQLLGCDDGSGCMAELAGSLGSDLLLTGNLVKVGSSWTVNVRFVRVRDAVALVTASERLPTLEAVQDWLDLQARAAPEKLRRALAGEEVSAPMAPWVVLGASAVVAAGGVVSYLWSRGDFAQLKVSSDLGQINQLAASGPLKQNLGIGLMIAGGVGVIASLVWALVGRPAAHPTVAIFVAPGAAGVALGGVWP